jgi:hypothetical protein
MASAVVACGVVRICLALALVLLFAANVFNFNIQIPEPAREHRNM